MIFSEDFDETVLELVGKIELPNNDSEIDEFYALTTGTKSWCSCNP
jgi:hypothetical protein